jgi:hypothetical protein
VGKTNIPLATIDLSCPSCKKTNQISFSQEIFTIPGIKLEVSENVVGKCGSCGHKFRYKNKGMIYKYMDKNKIAYQRPAVLKNRLILAVPIIIIIFLVIAIAAFAGSIHGSGSQKTGDHAAIANGSPARILTNSSGRTLLNANNTSRSVVIPTATPVPPSPLNVTGKSYYDRVNELYYLPVSLKTNASPVNLSSLSVTVGLDYQTVTPDAWQYSNTSCLWAVHNSTGPVLGRNDSATLVVDMSHYNFVNGTNVYLDFKIPGYSPLTCAFEMNRTNGTLIPQAPIIESGSYNYITGKSIDYNATDLVKVSGRVIINNWPESNIDVSFYDSDTTTTVTSVENGYYITDLVRNQSYRLEVWSTSYGTIFEDTTPRIFTNDTTMDILLNTN